MSKFNEEQLNSIKWYKGPKLVLGTPGSGKTTVIVNRICYLIDVCKVRPENILCFTFTRAAANSMKERFLKLSGDRGKAVRFGTFHSFFYWIINTAYANRNLGVMDEDKKRDVLRKILNDINKEDYDNEEVLTSVINQFGRISCDMIDINDYYSQDMPEKDFRTVYARYKEIKRTEGVLDFDDMITECYKLLTERPDIRQRIHEMYPFILVDEFQDTNLLQYKILKLLCAPENNLFAVGDDDQSIYGFRGARPDIMLSFEREFDGASVSALSVNYRCPKEVVSISEDIINNNKKRFSKKLLSAGLNKGHVYIERPATVKEENELIAERIANMHQHGVPYDEMAVLYRTNSNPRRLIYKLREYAIPFNIKDAMPDIFNSYLVTPILNYILFANGDNRRSLFFTFMNKPLRYIRRDMLPTERVGLKELLQEAGDKDYLKKNIMRLAGELDTIRKLNPYGAISYIRRAVGYENYLKEYCEAHKIDFEEVTDLLDELMSIAREFDTVDAFFEYIDEYEQLLKQDEASGNLSKEDIQPGVQLMTMHSAKGLEFKEVHIIDCIEGIIPHKRSKTMPELEEERRMFYVAVTRSSGNLYIYSPRTSGDNVYKISRFLDKNILSKQHKNIYN